MEDQEEEVKSIPRRVYKIFITGGGGNIATMIRSMMMKKKEKFQVFAPKREELNLLDLSQVRFFFETYGPFDIVFHTAVRGGRRTRPDSAQDVVDNLRMMEHLLYHVDKSQIHWMIHFDSGAVCDRSTSIFLRPEDHVDHPPDDYYGFAKYCLLQRTASYPNIHHLRVFNIFHSQEEPDRFIRKCFLARQQNEPLCIENNRYFDFMSGDDFCRLLHYYIEQYRQQTFLSLPKIVNCSYPTKVRLSEIAHYIGAPYTILSTSDLHYCGDGQRLASFSLAFDGLWKSLDYYTLDPPIHEVTRFEEVSDKEEKKHVHSSTMVWRPERGQDQGDDGK